MSLQWWAQHDAGCRTRNAIPFNSKFSFLNTRLQTVLTNIWKELKPWAVIELPQLYNNQTYLCIWGNGTNDAHWLTDPLIYVRRRLRLLFSQELKHQSRFSLENLALTSSVVGHCIIEGLKRPVCFTIVLFSSLSCNHMYKICFKASLLHLSVPGSCLHEILNAKIRISSLYVVQQQWLQMKFLATVWLIRGERRIQ